MFSKISPKNKKNDKKITFDSQIHQNNNSSLSDNIDDLVDSLLSKKRISFFATEESNRKSAEKTQNTFLIKDFIKTSNSLTFKKYLSVFLTFIVLFAAFGSASFVGDSYTNDSNMTATQNDTSQEIVTMFNTSNTTVSDESNDNDTINDLPIFDNSSILSDQDIVETDDNDTETWENETFIDNNESLINENDLKNDSLLSNDSNNTKPLIFDFYPSSGLNNIYIFPILNVTVSDPDGGPMNITWYSNCSGIWEVVGINYSVNNGTYFFKCSNFSEYNKTYYWYVSVFDNINTSFSSIFNFTTWLNNSFWSNPDDLDDAPSDVNETVVDVVSEDESVLDGGFYSKKVTVNPSLTDDHTVIVRISIPEIRYPLQFNLVDISNLYDVDDFELKDTDGNGLFDTVEWVVSHLSERTYELSIDFNKVKYKSYSTDTINNYDGSFKDIISLGAKNYYDDIKGEFKPIDTSIKLSEDGSFENVENNFKTTFKRQIGDEYLTYNINTSSISYSLKDQVFATVNNAEAQVDNNTIVYTDVFDGVDLKYTITSAVLLEEFILKNKNSTELIVSEDAAAIEKYVKIKNVYFVENTDGSISFKDITTDKTLWDIPRPVMYELNNPANACYDIHYSITKTDNGYILSKNIDQNGKEWLSSNERNYPLVIDDTHVYIMVAETDDHAYEGTDGDGEFAEDDAEFDRGDYENVQENDDSYVMDEAAVNQYQYHLFNFTIDESEGSISRINITWKGFGGSYVASSPPSNRQFGHSLWVKHESGGWTERDSGTSESKETLETFYTIEVAPGPAGAIIDGHLCCAAQSDYTGGLGFPYSTYTVLFSYFVELNVTYTANTAPTAAYLSGADSIQYAGKEYSFTTRHLDADGASNIEYAYGSMGADEGNITFRCDPNSGASPTVTVSPGSGYIIGTPTASRSSRETGWDIEWTYTIDWDWVYDDDPQIDYWAYTTDDGGANSGWQQSDQNADYENELILKDVSFTLTDAAYSEDGNTALTEGEWFRGGVGVYASGTICYEGATTTYPPGTTACDVQLWANGADLGESYDDDSLGSGTGAFTTPTYTTPSTSGLDTNYDFKVTLTDFISGASEGTGGADPDINSARDNEAPGAPTNAQCRPDSYSDTGEWDDDTTIYFTWTVASDGSGSGISTNTAGHGTHYAEIGDTTPDEIAGNDGQDADTGSEGTVTYYVRAVDNVGNYGSTDNDTIGIDLTDPTSSIDTISPYEQTSSPLTITSSDPTDGSGSGIKNVTLWYRYSSDNSSWGGESSESTYHFDNYDAGEAWGSSPANMADGSDSTYAYDKNDRAVQLLDGNNYTGSGSGTINWVHLKCRAYEASADMNIILRPDFSGGAGQSDGDNHSFATTVSAAWYTADITNDTNAPGTWTWTDIQNLDCDVEVDVVGGGMLYCSIVQIIVGYTIGDWMENTTDSTFPHSWEFSFPNNTGYYEFYSIACDNVSNEEAAPSSNDTMCYYSFSQDTSISVTPESWNQGSVSIGSSNETTSFNFTLINNGNVVIDVQIKADNATNSTAVVKWLLASSASPDNFTIQYNRSDTGTWANINTTYNTFRTNLDIDSSQTFDLKLIMATTSSTTDSLSFDITLKSVAS